MSSGGITLPKGFVFQPSDEVLVSYYLERKNQRKDPHITAIIPVINLCDHEPGDIPALVSGNSEWFAMVDSPDQWFFLGPVVFRYSKTKTKTKSRSPQIRRSTKEGHWKKQGDDKTITGASSDKQIGGKRILTFYLQNKLKTDWVVHEYYLTDPDSNEQIGDYVLYRLKNNSGSPAHDQRQQDPPLCNGGEASIGSCSMASDVEKQASGELGNVVVTPCGNDDEAAHRGGISSMATDVENQALGNVLPVPNGNEAEHGGSSCNLTPGFEKETAEYGLTEAEEEEHQTFKELVDAVWKSVLNKHELEGMQIDPGNLISEGQPDSGRSFDSDMVEELLDEPGDMLSLPHRSSSQLQSPIYTKPGTINAHNDEIRKRKCPFGDSNPSLTKKNHIDEADSNTASDSESQAADPIPDGYSHPGETLGSDIHSQEPQSISREPRDFPHDNNDIDWDQFPSLHDGFDLSWFPHPVIDGGNSERANSPIHRSMKMQKHSMLFILRRRHWKSRKQTTV